MLKHKASRRYEQALFDLSLEKDCLDQIYHDTQVLKTLLQESDDLRLFMANPEIPTEKRLAIFDSLFKDRVNPLTFNFLIFLDQKNRLNLTDQICSGFEALYLTHKGILKAEIYSARDMDKKHVRAISDRLSKKFEKEIQATVTLTPSLIAGFKVRVRDLIYDLSISSQLKKFKERIVSAV